MNMHRELLIQCHLQDKLSALFHVQKSLDTAQRHGYKDRRQRNKRLDEIVKNR
jgi:hypothetical protein